MKRFYLQPCFLALLVLLSAASLAQADPQTTYVTKDAQVADGWMTNNNTGGQAYVEFGAASGGDPANNWGLFEYPLPSIPAGTVVTSAVIHVTAQNNWNGSRFTINRITDNSWGEMTVKWTSKPGYTATNSILFDYAPNTLYYSGLDWDVTNMVKDAVAAGQSVVGFCMVGLIRGTDNSSDIVTMSKENNGGAYKSYLTVTHSLPNTPPPTPALSSPANGAISIPVSPTLYCRSVADPEGSPVYYFFTVDDNSDFSSPLFQDVPGAGSGTAGDTSYVIGTDYAGALANNKTYYWRVCAQDGSLPSAWSGTWNFKTNQPPPTPALSLPANGATGQLIKPTLYSRKVTDPDGNPVYYVFQLDNNSDFSSPVFTDAPGSGSGTAGDTSYVIGTDYTGALSASTTYYWRVYARDASLASGWSGSRYFTTMAPIEIRVDSIKVSNTNPTIGSSITITAKVYNGSSASRSVKVNIYRGNPNINYTTSNPKYPTTGLPIWATGRMTSLTATIPATSWYNYTYTYTIPDTNFYRFSAVSDPDLNYPQSNRKNDTLVYGGPGNYYPPGGSTHNVTYLAGKGGLRALNGSILRPKILFIIFTNNTAATPAAMTTAQRDTIYKCRDAFVNFFINHTKTLSPNVVQTIVDAVDIKPNLGTLNGTPYLLWDSPRVTSKITQNVNAVIYVWRGSPTTQAGGAHVPVNAANHWSAISVPIMNLGPTGDDDLDQLAERLIHEFLHHVDWAYANKAAEPKFPDDHGITSQTNYPNNIEGRWLYYSWICETWPAQSTTYKGWNKFPMIPAAVPAPGGDGETDAEAMVTAVPDYEITPLPDAMRCLPNPVTGDAVIQYQVKAPANTTVKIYNANGQVIRTLANGFKGTGIHSVRWDGKDAHGNKVAAGVYLCRMSAKGGSASGGETGGFTKINKMTVLR